MINEKSPFQFWKGLFCVGRPYLNPIQKETLHLNWWYDVDVRARKIT